MSLHSSKRKRIIAQTLYDEIGRRGGRFLARVDTGRRIKDVVKEGVWEEVPKKVGLKKVRVSLLCSLAEVTYTVQCFNEC